MAPGHGEADYLLFVDGRAVGVLEAKPAGHTLSGVEIQIDKYARGLPPALNPPVTPLPFLYLSTGVRTKFSNGLDPEPKSRLVFSVHRPETLAEWLTAPPLQRPLDAVAEGEGTGTAILTRPSSLRGRIQAMPPVHLPGLWPNKVTAIRNLDASMRADRQRALIQMATGSGKTRLAVTAIYRLIKFASARRVLFLVDRTNLGEQAQKEFGVPLAQTFHKGHGRIEVRTIWLSDELADYLTFPHAQVVFRLERRTSKLDGSSPKRGIVYGLTSRQGTDKKAAEQLLALVRGHWTVENCLHWVRDVTFDEDRSQVRKGNGPRAMASSRNTAISILRLAGAQYIAKAVRWCARHVDACQRLIGLA